MKHTQALKGGTALSSSNYTRDEFQTFDQATIDSAGAFLVGELERLDPMIHLPLVSTTWTRDIDLRTDVQIGDEFSSFTRSTFGSSGTPDNGINWASKEQTAIPRVTLDIAKITNPLGLVTYEVSYTIPELRSAELTGRPIDSQMLAGMNLKHQMDADQLVYIGDASVGSTGLVNSDTVVTNVSNVAAGASTLLPWSSKSPDEILADVNELLVSVWAATGYSVPPNKLLIAPLPYGYITSQVISIGGVGGGSETIYSFLQRRNVMTAEKGIDLDIKSVKWLDHGYRPNATLDRMIAYVQDTKFVRFPMVPLQPVQPQPRGIWIAVPYFGRFGVVEWVYTEIAGARDGI